MFISRHACLALRTPARARAAAVLLGLNLALCLVALSWVAPIAAQEADAGAAPPPTATATATMPEAAGGLTRVTAVEGITEYLLERNGLQVLLFPDASKPTVTVNVTYRVGSRHEGRGEAGMAHLLEHMVFKGTPTFDDIWGALEDHGARFNGSTWVDRTNYFETLPATDDNLDFALHMESDRMVNSSIAADAFAKEMTVVRNEFEMGENNPTMILAERMISAAYLWHPYGRSTIGNRSDIERVPVDRLRRFYRQYYQPDNAMLVVAGKFDVPRALELIDRYFGAIPRPERVLDDTYTEEPPQDGPRHVVLERVGDVAAAGLVYHVPAGPDADFEAVQVLTDVLTSQPAGRLYKALVETGLASAVHGSAYPWKEPGILELIAEVRLDQDVQQVLHTMIDVVEGVAASGISDEEVERIKTRRLKNIKLAMTNSGRIGIRLSESAALGDWRMFFIHRDRMKEVTTADVQRVAGTYLIGSNRTSGIFEPVVEPARATVPPAPDVAAITSGYTGTETIETGEVFEATTANIEARTHRETLAPSGIQVALLSKGTRGQAVRASFRLHFGTASDLTGHRAALDLLPRLLMRGTQQHDYQALRDEIDRLQSRINLWAGGHGVVGASIESDREHLVAAIELLGEILRQPAFAADQFGVLVNEQLSNLEEGLSDPQARGRNLMTRALNPWPPESIHYVPTLEEQIASTKALELDDLRALYAQFYGASHLQASVVGDFDEDTIKTTLGEVFGGWQSPAPYERVGNPFRAIEAGNEVYDTPDKPNAMIGMGTVFVMRDDDPDYPAMDLANYLLGGGAKSRLLTRLRHQGGLSYWAGSFTEADWRDRSALLSGVAICASQNADRALAAMREEIHRWIDEGVTAEELEEGKSSYALQFDNDLANDRFVAGELLDGLERDRTFAYHDGLLASIRALSVDDVRQVLGKYLGKAPFVEIKAGDLHAGATRDEGDEGGDTSLR